MSNVLVVAAHPDDEVLGCGVTIQHHKEKGDNVKVLIMTSDSRSRSLSEEQLHSQIKNSKKILDYDYYMAHSFPDQGLDTIRLTDLIKTIESQLERVDIVYTHHYGDINKDHRLTYEATITACRPTPTCRIKRLLSYWVPSSSEWMPYNNTEFKPTVIMPATKYQVKTKIKAMRAYKSEMRKWPHPRSPEGIETYAKSFGMQFGVEYAEPFQLLYDRS